MGSSFFFSAYFFCLIVSVALQRTHELTKHVAYFDLLPYFMKKKISNPATLIIISNWVLGPRGGVHPKHTLLKAPLALQDVFLLRYNFWTD